MCAYEALSRPIIRLAPHIKIKQNQPHSDDEPDDAYRMNQGGIDDIPIDAASQRAVGCPRIGAVGRNETRPRVKQQNDSAKNERRGQDQYLVGIIARFFTIIAWRLSKHSNYCE